jgi:hypothetical protein
MSLQMHSDNAKAAQERGDKLATMDHCCDLGRKADHTVKLLADPVGHLSRRKSGSEMIQISELNKVMSS